MKKLIFAALAVFSLSAHATVINFTAMGDGNVSTIGDVTFSLAGTGEIGNPRVDSNFGGGLWNSVDGPIYPTNTILRAEFSSGVTDVSWLFDNEGTKVTTFTIYDSALNVLASGINSTLSGFQNYDFSALTDVRRIDWDNNGNNWLFALGSIEFTVPEPGTLALLGLAFAFVGFQRRRSTS